MSEPFLGEIRLFASNFAPKGWALCNGQLLAINQNQALFALLGTMYGGNGQTTFSLPNLQGCVPIHRGAGHTQGERGGEQAHTLSINEIPTHTHVLSGVSNAAATNTPTSSTYLAATNNGYTAASNLVALAANELTSVGGSQAHLNMQPYLVLNFCIALQGIFPSQN